MPQTRDLLVFKNLLILFGWLRKWQNKKIWGIPFPQINSLTTENVEGSFQYRKTGKKDYLNRRKNTSSLPRLNSPPSLYYTLGHFVFFAQRKLPASLQSVARTVFSFFLLKYTEFTAAASEAQSMRYITLNALELYRWPVQVPLPFV